MIYAGILAGGTGTRMGISNMPKQFLDLGNKPIIIHTIEKFLLEPEIERIVVGVHEDWVSHTNGEYITNIPNRAHYYQGQTPQSFRCKDFLDLYTSLDAEEKKILTDACKIFVIKGKKVALARGEYSNLKVTTVTDLKIAKSMLEEE